MAMSSPLRTGGSGDLGMARNLSFSNFGTFAELEHHLGVSAPDHLLLPGHAAPRDLPRNFRSVGGWGACQTLNPK